MNGARGMDIVNLDASGSNLPETALLTASTLTGLGMANGVTYGGLAALAVYLGGGDNNFTILNTHSGSTFIASGAGNDAFNIQAIGGNTAINGGDGNDSFIVGTPRGNGRTIKTINAPLQLDGGSGNNRLRSARMRISNSAMRASKSRTAKRSASARSARPH